MDIYSKIAKIKEDGSDAFIVTVIDKSGMAPSDVGKKMIVYSSGGSFGTIGGGAIEHYAIEKCKASFKNRTSFNEKYYLMDKDVKVADDEIKLEMACGGKATLFYEFIGPKEHVYIFGAGHCGKELAKLLTPMNFYVTIIDNREELIDEVKEFSNKVVCESFEKYVEENNNLNDSYIIVATPSHSHDYQVLDKIFARKIKPSYFGMLCSKKKITDYLTKLKATYGGDINLNNFYSPIGLDLGGDSPEEIAVSIASEVLAVHYKKSNPVKHMKEKALTNNDACN